MRCAVKKNKLKSISFFILLCAGFLFTSIVAAQQEDYPKTFIFNFGSYPVEWLAKFDLVCDKGANARAIKNINPNCLVIDPAADWNSYGTTKVPNEWYSVDSEGNRVTIYQGRRTLKDITEYCPLVDGRRYNDLLIEEMVSTDFSVFDGVMAHGVWEDPYGVSDIDIDRNGVNDYEEHGDSWVHSKWMEGVEKIVAAVQEQLPNGKILILNSGRFHTFLWDKSNGIMLEHQNAFFGTFSWWLSNRYRAWMRAAPAPHAFLYEAKPKGGDPNIVWPSKNYFRMMRFNLFITMLGDGYYMFSDRESGEYYYNSYYDEFDASLGAPISAPILLREDVYVRFFNKGAIILNVSKNDVTVSDTDLRSLSGYNGPYYRFKGGQVPGFNSGELFNSVTLSGEQIPVSGNPIVGDGILLVNSPQTIISDIIIDNENGITSPGSDGVKLTGSWNEEIDGNADAWTCSGRAYADLYDYVWAPAGGGNAQAVFRPTIGVPGNYRVYEWHGKAPSGETAATDVPFELKYKTGKITGLINQQQNVGKWNFLGEYYFDKGTEGYFKMTNDAKGVVVADAVKFVFADNTDSNDDIPPNKPNALDLLNKTRSSLEFSWQPPDRASDGDIATYYKVYRDGDYIANSTSTYYHDTNLSENTSYTYTIYAVDDNNNVSEEGEINTFKTDLDVTPPQVISVNALSSTKVEIKFNETIEQSSAENLLDYQISDQVQIFSATLLSDEKTVQLVTSEHEPAKLYTITMNNIKDQATNGNAIAPNTTFQYSFNPIISITISADDAYDLYVNGELIGSGDAWKTAETYAIQSISGKNVIAVKGYDTGGVVSGLVAYIEFAGNVYVTSSMWKISTTDQSGWESILFDDATWQNAHEIGEYGQTEPWAGYGNVSGMPEGKGIMWIWANDANGVSPLYFRFTFGLSGDFTPPAPPQNVRIIRNY